MIATRLFDFPDCRQQLWHILNPVFYIHFLSDPNEILRSCVFQLIEKAVWVHDSSWIDWFDCLLGMGEQSAWMDWVQNRLPQADARGRVHSRLLLCVNTPSESLHRDDVVHYSLFIVEGVQITCFLNGRFSCVSPFNRSPKRFSRQSNRCWFCFRKKSTSRNSSNTLRRTIRSLNTSVSSFIDSETVLQSSFLTRLHSSEMFFCCLPLIQSASSTVESLSCLFLSFVRGLIDSTARSTRRHQNLLT